MKQSKKIKASVSGIFLAPSVLGVLLFFILPFFVVIFYSLLDNPISANFVGIENYINVFSNQAFRRAMGNTSFFSVIAVPVAVILAMGLAFLLDSGISGNTQLRSAFLTPLMVPTASIVLIWQVLFDYKGVVNDIIKHFGGGSVEWLKSGAGIFVLVLLFLGKIVGYNMVLFMAAIGNIPKDCV